MFKLTERLKKILEDKSGVANPYMKGVRSSAAVTIIIDVILIVALLACLFSYIYLNNIDTYNQNIENIKNIATAKSELVQLVLDNSSSELMSVYGYCVGKSVGEALEFLTRMVGPGVEYQLLELNAEDSNEKTRKYRGYSSKTDENGYIPVHYENTALVDSIEEYRDTKGQIHYSQNFTNTTDALKYYAAFCGITLTNDDGESGDWFLIKLQKGSMVLDQLRMYSQYNILTTAICSEDGKYLANDSGFKADNFYDYIYEYNGLSIDERNRIRASVQSDEDGVGLLEYKDYKNRDCAFVYVKCGNTADWYVFVALPQSEFITGQLITFFPLIIILFLVVLLVFNAWRLLQIVKQLRQSVEREIIANASKSSFLSRMSHEIRTPLNAVMGYMTIAKNSGDNIAKIDDCIVKTEISAKHLLSVINDILDISAIENGKMKIVSDSFNFKSLINSITVMFYTLANEKNVFFEVIFENIVDEAVIGDQMRVNQILINLLNNAVKFTPPNGKVTLKIKQEPAGETANNISFTVTDTGIGMSEEYLGRIWQPFEQADNTISRKFGGSGLGLAITKALVDMMGGSISVQSKSGVGSSFNVVLKFGKTEQPYSNRYYNFSAYNVLVVDDDKVTCDYTKELLNHYNVRCATAASGEEALSMMAAANFKRDPYNLCLIDMQMSGMNGLETSKRIMKDFNTDIPVIILSAYDLSEYMEEASAIGVKTFLAKPLFKSALFDLLVSLNSDNAGDLSVGKTPGDIDDYDFGGARILLTEDNQTNMEIAVDLLSFVNITTEQAWNGEEAYEMFLKSPPGYYKAILMDVQMPVLDGHSAARKIRASVHPEAKTIPIIAMTANAFEQDINSSLDAGMNDHISKPIDEKWLYEVLKRFGV